VVEEQREEKSTGSATLIRKATSLLHRFRFYESPFYYSSAPASTVGGPGVSRVEQVRNE
jgi:hypothetical protein